VENPAGLVIINAKDGEIENSYFFYDKGTSLYPSVLLPNHKDLIEPFLPNEQIIAFTDNDSLRFLVGIIEFELADGARVKSFITKAFNTPITNIMDNWVWTLSVDNHADPFVSVCFINRNLPSQTGLIVTFDSFLNQKMNDITFSQSNERCFYITTSPTGQ